MSGSKKVTTGFYYHLGVHMVLCQGPVDKLLKITAEDKTVFEGSTTGGTLSIDKNRLFGGDTGDGGVIGDIDISMGDSDQIVNDYLESQQGVGSTPAYRGVVSAIFRQVNLGTNPYMRPWKYKLQRVFTKADGETQWYPEKAGIGTALNLSNDAIFFTLDTSGSMTGTRLTTVKTAMSQILDLLESAQYSDSEPSDINITIFSDVINDSIEEFSIDAAGFDNLRTFVSGISIHGTTSFDAALSGAEAFFASTGEKRKIVIFLTDGQPTPSEDGFTYAEALSDNGVEIYAFNIDLVDTTYTDAIDNTGDDGVPVLDSGDVSEFVTSISNALASGLDMNPVHILRECITDKEWGLGFDTSEVGTSFTTAADTLYDEGFGLSAIWNRQTEIDDFMQDILAYIDAALYVDNETGLWEIKLIRNDYNVVDLTIIDDTHVVEINNDFERIDPIEAINSVTVNYTNPETGKTKSITAHDQALVSESGVIRSTSMNFEFIRQEDLAGRVALRELLGLSSPVLSGTIVLNRLAPTLKPGEAFILNLPRYEINSEIVRVTSIEYDEKNSEKVTVGVVTDVFSLSTASIFNSNGATPGSFRNYPAPVSPRMVNEAPYWLLALAEGDSGAKSRTDATPEVGFLQTAGDRPTSDTFQALVYVDDGGGYDTIGTMIFTPSATTATALTADPTDVTFDVTLAADVTDVTTGSLASIGDEIVRVDAVSGTQITIGRGCLDTIPQEHAAGVSVFFWGVDPDTGNEEEYAAGETIDVKLLTITGLGTLTSAEAPTDQVTFDSRAARPFPVGNLQADGEYIPTVAADGSDIVLTWNHRDRLTQTSPTIFDYTDTDVGPETGVTYSVEATYHDASGTQVGTALADTDVGTDKTYTLTAYSGTFPVGVGAIELWIKVHSNRDGLTEWQTPTMKFSIAFGSEFGYGASYGASYGA